MQEVPVPPNPRFSLVEHAGDIASLFGRFDAAIAAGGNTAWELMCMGMPTVLIQTAENQRGIIKIALSAGAALDGGDAQTNEAVLSLCLRELTKTGRRRQLSTAALKLVDGKGPQRIVDELTRI
jgi:spore coat polysaccharide biosynthesis predicted glycosyltransferase SpsG